MNQPRATQRYVPAPREDEDRLTQAIVALASKYGRYGYRRITALLRCDGWHVGKDRLRESIFVFPPDRTVFLSTQAPP